MVGPSNLILDCYDRWGFTLLDKEPNDFKKTWKMPRTLKVNFGGRDFCENPNHLTFKAYDQKLGWFFSTRLQHLASTWLTVPTYWFISSLYYLGRSIWQGLGSDRMNRYIVTRAYTLPKTKIWLAGKSSNIHLQIHAWNFAIGVNYFTPWKWSTLGLSSWWF